MYLHIGNGVTVRKKDVIGIFDLDSSTVSHITKSYINKNQRAGKISYGDMDLPRTFVLVKDTDGCSIKLSRISSQGLKIRAESDDYCEN
jgi:hypothetical protein